MLMERVEADKLIKADMSRVTVQVTHLFMVAIQLLL